MVDERNIRVRLTAHANERLIPNRKHSEQQKSEERFNVSLNGKISKGRGSHSLTIKPVAAPR